MPTLALISSWLPKIVLVLGIWLLLALAILPGISFPHTVSNAQSVGAEHLAAITVNTPTPDCSPSWNVVTSPNPSIGTNFLFGVTAISPTDIWAVGYYGASTRGQTLTLHWNGTEWTHVPSPSPGTETDVLLDVSAISPNNIWAVGYSHDYGGSWLTLIEHWNGTQWSIVSSPNPRPVENYLRGVSVVSPNDVWAVGYWVANVGGYGYNRTLIEHWDGTQWSVVPSPNVGTNNNRLDDVVALSENDVWAVGSYTLGAGGLTLIEHWDGSQWSVVPSPNPTGAQNSWFNAVSASASNDVWAVGFYQAAGPGTGEGLVEHWDGTQWSIIPTMSAGPGSTHFFDVASISPTDVWAVGYYCCGANGLITLTEHWDGTAWTIIPSPNRSMNNNYLQAVSALSSNDVWAAGYDDSVGRRTLLEHYTFSDTCLTSTPSPSPSPSSVPFSTQTYTAAPTPISTVTPTVTTTPTPQMLLVGHVNWESRPAHPHELQRLPITLTLRSGTTEVNYPAQLTDQYGYFTVALGGLPNGSYTWRADDAASEQHPPNYLANSGVVNIGRAMISSVEMGVMKVGDADDNNRVNVSDFNLLKVSFGAGCGNPAYDNRTDFSGDCLINISDFNPLKRNFGQSGAPPIIPQNPPKFGRKTP